MLSGDYSSRKPFKEACCSLLTIAIGAIACSIIAVLVYFTYEAAAGNMSYCILWTDIPGRLAIFLTLYYAAGICGVFPIPEHFRLNCLPPPFILYRLESWKNLFGKVCLLFTFSCQTHEALLNDPEISPIRNGSSAHAYDSSPTSREQSEKIPIAKTDTPRKNVARSNKSARNRDIEMADDSEESSLSFDSSMGGPIVPMVKGKCSKPRYFTDSTLSTTESSEKSVPNAIIESLYEVSETLNNRAKAVVKVCSETDTPQRTPDVKLTLPRYPRFPWGLLKNQNDIPKEAKALHKRHLIAERRELDKLKKKQMEENVPSPADTDSDWRTESDEFNPFSRRRLRLPLITARGKTGFRSRTKTTSGAIHNFKKSKNKNHKRKFSCPAPHKNQFYASAKTSPESEDNSDKDEENKCCENSPDLQSKAEHIKETLMRLGPNFQASSEALISKQNVDSFSNLKSAGEASTSRQNILDFHSKILDSETLTSEQSRDTSSGVKSDSEESTNRQYIERIYQYFP